MKQKTLIASFKSVSRAVDGRLALSDLSFDLHAGEVVALLGPNGAGKTTSIRILLGLSGVTSGEVSLFGHRAGSRTARERTGALLQVGEASVPENLRIDEHIDLFRSYYPRPLPMSEILEIAGLTGLEKRRFGKLSGGEQQRLLFALAICGNPDLLFLDEPTVSMDVETRRAMWQQIRRFAAMGKTILLTTHYLEEADALANRIVVLKRGRKIAEGTPAEIKAISGKCTVACKTNLSAEQLRRMEAVVSVFADGRRTLITTSAPEATVRELMALDPDLSDLELTTAALEDAFVLLTERDECADLALPGDSV
ncbi:ABC transporter ATP-binding protein [Pandoraea communis]|uniref:ABC transporter ATP-binding protein n=1 Tax=Pandoraea communis TaxID=2508297 RepID=UPI001C2CF9ED|nr:ABC transporter ATP-binding protein [Pandoraea communis]MDM8359091.1 ABC transporter ATP-binding protein [Pandoraea communis]